jgi:hypothetical protein
MEFLFESLTHPHLIQTLRPLELLDLSAVLTSDLLDLACN